MSEDRELPYKQRYGFEDLPEPMKLGQLSSDIRRKMWNLVRQFLYYCSHNAPLGRAFTRDGRRSMERIIGEFKKIPEDQVHTEFFDVQNQMKYWLIQYPAEDVVGLVELLVRDSLLSADPERVSQIEKLLETHRAPYRLDLSAKPYCICHRTSREESDATMISLSNLKEHGFGPALSHLRQATIHINDGQFSDAVHDSISAVESVARSIEPDAKTLEPALKKLQSDGVIKHSALKNALSSLYGYTSDKQGLRHALIYKDAADVGLPEALFFYNACAAFAGYLANVGNVRR